MKNESGLHFLGWMILANVTESVIFRGFCIAMAFGYVCIGIYEAIVDWRRK